MRSPPPSPSSTDSLFSSSFPTSISFSPGILLLPFCKPIEHTVRLSASSEGVLSFAVFVTQHQPAIWDTPSSEPPQCSPSDLTASWWGLLSSLLWPRRLLLSELVTLPQSPRLKARTVSNPHVIHKRLLANFTYRASRRYHRCTPDPFPGSGPQRQEVQQNQRFSCLLRKLASRLFPSYRCRYCQVCFC